ncbi:MAG: type I-C CRISPR-associated protein Cas8c/Csd1 [Halothiobacillaceae bacterium]
MILQALYDYYQRKREELPAEGLERKEIPFLIVLKPDGSFLHIEDTREGEGRKKRGKTFLVPQAVKKSVNVAANLLWGNLEYVLGEADPKKLADNQAKGKEAKYRQRLLEMHAAFKEAIQSLPEQLRTRLNPVITFLDRGDFSGVQADPLWPEVQTGANISFKIAGEETPVCSLPEVLAAVEVRTKDSAGSGLCLITGERDAIQRIHPPIKRVRGAQTSGADIVSFNLPAFCSYGRSQGANAPVGMRAAAAYTTALNHLLASDQCIQVGDATTVFWAERAHPLENWLAQLLDEPPKDNPDQGAQALKALYAMPLTGVTAIDETPTRFFVLGLAAPSKSRLTIRFWHVATVGELAGNIRQHFKDLEIVRPQYVANPFLSLKTLLTAVAPPSAQRHDGDIDSLPPRLAGDFMHAILHGLPYPQPLLQAVLTRIRADQAKKRDNGKPIDHVTYARAALIKAWLNRHLRNHHPQEREIAMALDESCTNLGYRLGRLFAVLERIQQDAAGGPDKINTTIRDSYFGSAMSTPGAVFPTIMRRNQHHMAKLRKEKPGLSVVRDRLVQAVLNEGVDCAIGFPATLSLPDQGRFVLGYYQQRQALSPKSEIQPETTEEGSVQ